MNFSSLIDRYLEGKLKGDQLERFEQELKEDPSLAEKVRNIKSLMDTVSKYAPQMKLSAKQIMDMEERIGDEIDRDIDKYSSDKIRNDAQRMQDRLLIKKILKENRPPAKPKSCRIRDILIVAASLAVIISIGCILCIHTYHFDPDELYDEHYSKLLLFSPERSVSLQRATVADPDSASLEDLYNAACKHYNRGEYHKAIQLAAKYPEQTGYIEKCYLMSGISYMELGNYHQAIAELSKVKVDLLLTQEAQWYLGLSYLKTREFEKALAQFQKLASLDVNIYGDRSRKIARKLDWHLKRNQPTTQ